jgi:predicted nucleic acid-binding protein
MVVSDTSPICYLAAIGLLELLPPLFGSVCVPPSVCEKLGREFAPEAARSLVGAFPTWSDVRDVEAAPDPALLRLGSGERDAILLAEQIAADFILIDDLEARELAFKRGLRVIGLIGVLGPRRIVASSTLRKLEPV